MSDNFYGFDVDKALADLPAEFRQKVAAIGAANLLAEQYQIDFSDVRGALLKIGHILANDAVPYTEIQSGLDSYRKLTEGK